MMNTWIDGWIKVSLRGERDEWLNRWMDERQILIELMNELMMN